MLVNFLPLKREGLLERVAVFDGRRGGEGLKRGFTV